MKLLIFRNLYGGKRKNIIFDLIQKEFSYAERAFIIECNFAVSWRNSGSYNNRFYLNWPNFAKFLLQM